MSEVDNIEIFKEANPLLESYWRSIILFGRNVASYKFALAQSLLDLSDNDTSFIPLDTLAVPFSTHICEHLKHAPKQATSATSTFLSACKSYNAGELSQDGLIQATVRNGFNCVLDAFHIVNNGEISVRFFEKSRRDGTNGIILTDNIYKLREIPFWSNLANETESRWNLVETAWELNVSRSLLNVQYDDAAEILFVDDKLRRKDVTSARDALNGYQKGKCFYCYDDIDLNSDSLKCDVDHFFPHSLQPIMKGINLNGVWNLVLACPSCNRGAAGKFARVPSVKYLERLYKRNEYLISSFHPLRETLISQTGATPQARAAFLHAVDHEAINCLIHRWEVPPKGDATF